MEDRRNSLPALILEAIFTIREEGGELSVKAITEHINKEDFIKEHLERSEQTISPRKVGSIVRRDLGLKTKKAIGNRRAVIQWDERRMAILSRRYGFLIPSNNASHASPETDMLHPDPSPKEPYPSYASSPSGIKISESEAYEACEASRRRIEHQTSKVWEELL